jgi:hypothetical protein
LEIASILKPKLTHCVFEMLYPEDRGTPLNNSMAPKEVIDKEKTVLKLARLGAPRVFIILSSGVSSAERSFRSDRENFLERLVKILPEPKTGRFSWAFLSNHASGSPQHKAWLSDYPMKY